MNAPAFVDAALALRRSHPEAPAREVLDLVMQGHSTTAIPATADWLDPSHPFAELVCAAFDTVMVLEEWRIMTQPQQEHRVAMLQVWRDHVVSRFLARYASGERRDVVAEASQVRPQRLVIRTR